MFGTDAAEHAELQEGIHELEKQLKYLQQLQDDDTDPFPEVVKPSSAVAYGKPIGDLGFPDVDKKKPLTEHDVYKEIELEREAEKQREEAWRKELAERERQLQEERDREREKRLQRQKEREEWEAKERQREEERLLKEWELKEQMLEEEREHEWEEEQKHERERDEAFHKELDWEKEKQHITDAAMLHQHKAAEERLAQILDGQPLQKVEELDVHKVVRGIDSKMLEEEKQRIALRDELRAQALQKERERQRELEKQWQEQIASDAHAEEEAIKMKEKLAIGQFMDIDMLKKVKRKIYTEEAKAEVPTYLISCVIRTLEEAMDDRESVFHCTAILCCLLHGPYTDRKKTVCDAIASCTYGIRPLVRVMNQYHHDSVIMSHIMCILKLAASSSRKFSAHALAAGGFDVANTVSVPGLQGHRFGEFTVLQARNFASEARLTLQAVMAMLDTPNTSIMHLIHGLEKLKMTLGNTDPEEVRMMDMAPVLFDIVERLANEEYIVVEVLQLAIQPYLIKEVGTAMAAAGADLESRGLKFLHSILKLMRGSSNSRVVQLGVEFLMAVWHVHPSATELLIRINATATFVFCADRFAHLKDLVYFEWEQKQIGNTNLKDLFQDVYSCAEFSYELRAYLFDLSVRFSKDQPSEILSDHTITFLAENLGVEILKFIFETVPLAREAVLHVLWTMLQSKDKMQYTERFAEEIMDGGLFPLLLTYLVDPECTVCLHHCVDVIEFISSEYAEAETHLLRNSAALAEAYNNAVLSVSVLPEGRKRLIQLITTVTGDPPIDPLLDDLFNLQGTEPTEVVVPILLRMKHTPPYIPEFRSNASKHLGTAVTLLKAYDRVPEIELLLLEILADVITENAKDTLNGPVADQFCDIGGIDRVLTLIERYSSDNTVSKRGWGLLLNVFKFASPTNVSNIRNDERLLPLLAVTRTGGLLLAYLTRHRDLVDILREVIVALHVVEDKKLGINPEDIKGEALVQETPRAKPALIHENENVRNLVAAIYVLTDSLAAGIRSVTSPRATTIGQQSPERLQEEVMKLVDEGGARALCRCLETGASILPLSCIIDMLNTLLSLLNMSPENARKDTPKDGKRAAAEALASESLLLTANSNAQLSQTQPSGNQASQNNQSVNAPAPAYGSAQSMFAAAGSMMISTEVINKQSVQNKAREQVRSRIESIIGTLQLHKYSREVSDRCLSVLSNVCSSVESMDDEDFGPRLVRACVVEQCFSYVWTHGILNNSVIKDVLIIMYALGTIEDLETDIWLMGGFDLAYVTFNLCTDGIVRAMAVACMSNHALYSDERRNYVLLMDGVQFALSLLQGGIICWESSWAAMKMLAAVSMPNERFIVQTVGEGLMYIIAQRLSAYHEPKHTRAAAQCLLYLLRVSLSYRTFKRDNEKHNPALATQKVTSPSKALSPGSNSQFGPAPPTPGGCDDINLWISNAALTCSMELLIYRVTQLFAVNLIDLATIDFTTQYITTAIDLMSNDINTRLLKCNVRKLLTYMLAYEGVTMRIRKDAETCLQTLQQFAELHGFHDFQSQYVRSTAKPVVPLPPDGVLPHTMAIEKTSKRTDENGTTIGGKSIMDPSMDDDEEDDDDPDNDETPFDGQLDPEDKDYLRRIKSREMYHELTSILLTYQPEEKSKAYKLIAQFFAEKAVRC
eukprot:TRINITY_DN64332_c0_g1_i1.p1 TRINITY_DN64332_c0_g1~~TRINITY_DN64332_c0_g1_i1.p1  ORF type:complete len:1657 (+),score=221.22 TRINITY_DN64332_c0_g1_i1:58-5028(+)